MSMINAKAAGVTITNAEGKQTTTSGATEKIVTVLGPIVVTGQLGAARTGAAQARASVMVGPSAHRIARPATTTAPSVLFASYRGPAQQRSKYSSNRRRATVRN